MAGAGYLRASLPQRDWTRGGAITWPRSRIDEVDTYRADLADWLDDSETCSSVTAVDTTGVTVSSITVTSAGVISVTLSRGGNGSLGARVVTSASRVKVVPMQWRAAWAGAADAYS